MRWRSALRPVLEGDRVGEGTLSVVLGPAPVNADADELFLAGCASDRRLCLAGPGDLERIVEAAVPPGRRCCPGQPLDQFVVAFPQRCERHGDVWRWCVVCVVCQDLGAVAVERPDEPLERLFVDGGAVALQLGVVFAIVVDDEVDVVALAPAGQAGVAGLSVEPVVAEQQGPVVGRPLGFVDGGGVGVIEVVGDVVVGERPGPCPAIGLDHHAAPIGVDIHDGGEHGVVHAQSSVVVEAHHAVTGGEGPVPYLEPVGGHVAIGHQQRPGAGVEFVDVGSA
jgi:hypothetical protein